MKRRRGEKRGMKRDFGNVDQKMANALAGIVLAVVDSRIGRRMVPQQTANQGIAIFVRAALQAICIAAKNHAHKLNDQ